MRGRNENSERRVLPPAMITSLEDAEDAEGNAGTMQGEFIFEISDLKFRFLVFSAFSAVSSPDLSGRAVNNLFPLYKHAENGNASWQ